MPMMLGGDGYFVRFAKMDRIYRKMCYEAVAEYQFTPNEIVVLMFLSNNAPLDTAKDIVHHRNISKSLVARSVESLCRQGFLSAETDQLDRRVVHLRLSERSRDIVDRLKACKEAFLARLMNGIAEEDLVILNRATEMMNANLEAMVRGSGKA